MTKMMKSIAAFLSVLMIALSPIALAPAHALEPALETAKVQGKIGESVDGYLYVIEAGDPSLDRKVAEINAKRRSYYASLAEKENASVAQVARVAGERNLSLQPSGVFVFTAEGKWEKK